jgi:hypothetical protein
VHGGGKAHRSPRRTRRGARPPGSLLGLGQSPGPIRTPLGWGRRAVANAEAPSLRESTEKSQGDEIAKYGSAFQDPRNKVNHLEIVTNDDKAGAYYDAMLAAKGVPGETRIVK